jgi:hypothetical protein
MMKLLSCKYAVCGKLLNTVYGTVSGSWNVDRMGELEEGSHPRLNLVATL